MDPDCPLKIKTIDEIHLEKYQNEEDIQNECHKKYSALKKSNFSKGNSMIFDSEDETVTNKENRTDLNIHEKRNESPHKVQLIN